MPNAPDRAADETRDHDDGQRLAELHVTAAGVSGGALIAAESGVRWLRRPTVPSVDSVSGFNQCLPWLLRPDIHFDILWPLALPIFLIGPGSSVVVQYRNPSMR